jgi:tetratricopeptide (TPR) repeat protein
MQRNAFLGLLGVCFLCWVQLGCRHMPSPKEIKQAETLWTLGVKQSNRGEFRQALAILHRAEELNPQSYWIQEAIGGTLMRMGYPDRALKYYKRALEIEPKSPRGWNNLGSVYSALNKWKEAIASYHKALDNILYQTPCFAEMNLGWAYHMDKQPAPAVRYLNLAISHCPRVCQGYRLLGLVLLAQERYAQAEESFREVVQRCEKFAPGYHSLAQTLLKQQKYRDAEPILEKCQELSKEDQPAVRKACIAMQRSLQQQKGTALPSSVSIRRAP